MLEDPHSTEDVFNASLQVLPGTEPEPELLFPIFGAKPLNRADVLRGVLV